MWAAACSAGDSPDASDSPLPAAEAQSASGSAGQPSVPVEQPAVAAAQPSAPVEQPTVAAAQPTVAAAQPTATAEQPSAPAEQPTATAEQPTATAEQPSAPAEQPRPSVVPERELTGLNGWINSEPLTIAGLIADGRVVLVDFWTYTCVNCIRTMPYLREWHEKYGERGLTILGIHAPEFDFEKDRDNVIDAVQRRGLQYPVAQDNQMSTWRAFQNRFWPAKYLIGVDGTIRYQHFGEGAYQQTEQEIRSALEAAGWDIGDIPLGNDEPLRDPDASGQTRELYGGYRFNYLSIRPYAAQEQYYEDADIERFYLDEAPHEDGLWYLQGSWRNEREAIVHARTTVDFEDYIALSFRARAVNVVLSPTRDEPFVVTIELEGRPLAPDEAGGDVEFDGQGRSIIRVDQPRLYAIVQLPAFGERELTLRANSDDFAVFAFTFGAYLEGP